MKKVLLTLAMMLMVMPSIAAPNDKLPRSTPRICEGKVSAEAYIKALSDYELLRGMTNIMSDSRTTHLRSAHELHLWLQGKPDCAVWVEGTYFMEVKWLYNEALFRGLTTTLNKIGQGVLRWNPIQDRFEEWQETRWVPWNASQK